MRIELRRSLASASCLMLFAGCLPINSALAQAVTQTPAIAPAVPNQTDPPANPPASNPPVFVETSSGSPGIGLTDQEFQSFQSLSTELGTNLGRKDELKDEFDALPGGASIGTYIVGTAIQLPGESQADFEARRAQMNALKTEWVQLNDRNRDINGELKPLAKKIRQNTDGVRCADQLTPAIYGVSVAGAAMSLAGTIAEAATSPTSPVGGEIASNIITAIGHGLDVTSLGLEGVANTLPNCEGVFTGTVQTYANFISKMGLSAFDGNITIGYPGSNDPNNPSEMYYQGITLGGGGLAGAGAGGAQAYTGHVSAVAIGNGARAEAQDSTALGTNAHATQVGATAIGAHSEATGLFSTAIGYQSNAFGESSVAIGNTATAAGTNGIAIGTATNTGNGANNTAVGTGINIANGSNNNTVLGVGHGVAGNDNFVGGDPNETYGNDNAVVGNDNFTQGNNNQVLGNNNGTLGTVIGGVVPDGNETPGVRGNNNSVIGSSNRVSGIGAAIANNNKVLGDGNTITGNGNNAVGNTNTLAGDGNVAVGTGIGVTANNAIAIGTAASVVGNGNIAIGQQTSVNAAASLAVGSNASVGANSSNSAAFGQGATVAAASANSLAVGQGAVAAAGAATAVGQGSAAVGVATSAFGTGASAASSSGSTAVGAGSSADGSVLSTAVGVGATVDGSTGGSAFGGGATVAANTVGGTASGVLANARANNASAYGFQADARGANSTAVGASSHAMASGSAAFGNGAVATMQDQQSFGTAQNTYTMGGITSDRSQSRQSGPLQLVTTDANGNLAADNGSTFQTIAKLQAGVAISLASEAPPLAANENFGIRIGWGNFEGEANAMAASAIGVLCRTCFTSGDRISVDGSVGAGWSDYKTYSAGNTFGGRAGVSWTW